MKQELGPNQKAWLAALRSGEYPQSHRGALLDLTQGYCCLGVACVVASIEPTTNDDQTVTFFGGCAAIAPDQVIDQLKLYSSLGSHRFYGPSLAQLNDGGATFSEIADVIEENPGLYFTEPA